MRKYYVKSRREISLHKIIRRKANFIDQNLCRKRVLEHVIGGKIEGEIKVKEKRNKT